MGKYKRYYGEELIDEYDAPNDQIALMMANSKEPYPNKVTRVEGDKEVIIKPLG